MDVARPRVTRPRRISRALVIGLVLAAFVLIGVAAAYNEVARVDPLELSVYSGMPGLDGDHPAALGADLKNTGRVALTVTGFESSGMTVLLVPDDSEGEFARDRAVPFEALTLEPGESAQIQIVAPINGCTEKERADTNRGSRTSSLTMTYTRLGVARTADLGFDGGSIGIRLGHNIRCSVANAR